MDFLAAPTDEDDLANHMNEMEQQLQEMILRDIQVTNWTTGQQGGLPQTPLQIAATTDEDKEQFDQLIPIAQETYVGLQKEGAYNLRVLRESPNKLANNFCSWFMETA